MAETAVVDILNGVPSGPAGTYQVPTLAVIRDKLDELIEATSLEATQLQVAAAFANVAPYSDPTGAATATALGLLKGLYVASQSSLPSPVSSTERLIDVAATTLTRPANVTPYSSGDSISNNATAGSVTALPATVSDVNDSPVAINAIRVHTTDTGIGANGQQIRVYAYNSDPTASSGVLGGDNAAFSNKGAGFIGTFVGVFKAFSDGGVAICLPEDGQEEVIAIPETGGKRIWLQYQILSSPTPSANSTTLIGHVLGRQGRI